MTELAQAHALPELAVLSAAAHGHTPDAEHQAAAPDLLEHWGERLLSASSLDDVFAGSD